MNFFWSFIVACILSVFFTGIICNIAQKYRLAPKLRERDSHQKPTPRIGGIAIFTSFIFTSLFYFLLVDKSAHISNGQWFGIDKRIVAIWIASGIIALSMLVDDLKNLKAWIKLVFQLIAVAVLIASGIGIDFLSNPFGSPISLNTVYIPLHIFGSTYHFSLWSDLLTMFWLVGMMNVTNFIDGIDGLASGVSAIGAFILFLLSLSVGQPAVAMISIILSGSALGFLYWNFYPAKIFMGDCGAMFLGLMLGVLPLISGGKLATAFLVFGFAIVDGLIVAAARVLRRKNPFTTPDKTHLHHRFLAAGFSVPATVLSLYTISALFGWVALRSTTWHKIIASSILVLVVAALILILNQIKKNRN